MFKKEIILDLIDKFESSSDLMPLDTIIKWMQNTDIEVMGAIADIITYRPHCYRIIPEVGEVDLEKFLLPYYEMCFETDPDSEYALNRYQAARAIYDWFNAVPDDEDIYEQTFLIHIKEWLEKYYKRSNNEIRLAIINGALEHILEDKRWRNFFKNWGSDAILCSAYFDAMEWALAHER